MVGFTESSISLFDVKWCLFVEISEESLIFESQKIIDWWLLSYFLIELSDQYEI